MSIFDSIFPKKKSSPQETQTSAWSSDAQVRTEQAVKPKKWTHPDDSTQRYLPFSEIRDNLVIMKDGSARMILRVEAVNFSLKSEDEQDSIIYSFQHFLNAIQFPIQILIRSLKVDIEGYLNRLKNLTTEQQNPLLKEQSERYVEFLTNLVNVAQIMKKEFYIVIPHDETDNQSVAPKGMIHIIKAFFGGVSQTVTLEQIRHTMARMQYLKKKCHEKATMIQSSLQYVWIQSHILEKEDVIELMMSYYDPKVNSVSKVLDTKVGYDITG